MGKNSGSDALPLAIASSKQEKISGGMHVYEELPYTVDAIGGRQALLCKDILELSVVLIGKFQVVRLLDQDPLFLSLSDTATAGARHVGEEFIFVTGQINFESAIDSMLNTESAKVAHSQVPIHHL
jgi:hypothetical protein